MGVVCWCRASLPQVHPAPGPEEVNWQHVWMSGVERDVRTAFTWPLTIALVLFPITLVTSAVSRIEYVFCPGGSQDNVSVHAWAGPLSSSSTCHTLFWELPSLYVGYPPGRGILCRSEGHTAHGSSDDGACWRHLPACLQTFYWEWYCTGREQGSSLQSFIRAFMTGWLPSLLLNLWLAMVMPRLVYLIVQVGATSAERLGGGVGWAAGGCRP